MTIVRDGVVAGICAKDKGSFSDNAGRVLCR